MSNRKRSVKKIDFCEANNRFSLQRDDIVLCKGEFVSWKKKAKFWDNVIKDYWWARPEDVYRLQSVHPNRRNEKYKKTLLRKYNVDHMSKIPYVKEKKKQNYIKKYGVDNPAKSKIVQDKIKETNIRKYGTLCVLNNKEIQNKIKQTCVERYGVSNALCSEKIIKKRITNLRVAVKNPKVIEKRKQTCIEKYGKNISNPAFLNKKRIVETGEWVKDWLKKQPEPKPAYNTISGKYKNILYIPEKELNILINGYKDYKSSIEIHAEQVLRAKHYNKKVPTLNFNCRPDFKLNPKTYLNVDGLYWHCELQKDKWYHFVLREEFENNNLRMFQFREDELRSKSKIIKSIVNNSLGKIKKKIPSRKCKIQRTNQNKANKFLSDNHLMSTVNAKHIGLFYKNQLVSILSYKYRKNICKIERFCSLNDHVVVGGFSKLLKYLENNCLPENITEVHNWVDLRYGNGYHLENKGFIKEKDTLGWKWTDGKNTFNRLKCRANMDERELSQQEHAKELNWVKIYDAGQRLYIKKINK